MLKEIRRHVVNEYGTHGFERFLRELAGDANNWTLARRYQLSRIQVSFARKHGLELWALSQPKKRATILPFVYGKAG